MNASARHRWLLVMALAFGTLAIALFVRWYTSRKDLLTGATYRILD